MGFVSCLTSMFRQVYCPVVLFSFFITQIIDMCLNISRTHCEIQSKGPSWCEAESKPHQSYVYCTSRGLHSDKRVTTAYACISIRLLLRSLCPGRLPQTFHFGPDQVKPAPRGSPLIIAGPHYRNITHISGVPTFPLPEIPDILELAWPSQVPPLRGSS